MATQTQDEKGQSDDKFFVFVDGEKFFPATEAMTPNLIIDKATDLDSTTHYLLRTNREKESFKDKGEVPINLKKGDRYQVVALGPTPVS